jgi:hypothetical protein
VRAITHIARSHSPPVLTCRHLSWVTDEVGLAAAQRTSLEPRAPRQSSVPSSRADDASQRAIRLGLRDGHLYENSVAEDSGARRHIIHQRRGSPASTTCTCIQRTDSSKEAAKPHARAHPHLTVRAWAIHRSTKGGDGGRLLGACFTARLEFDRVLIFKKERERRHTHLATLRCALPWTELWNCATLRRVRKLFTEKGDRNSGGERNDEEGNKRRKAGRR